MFVRKKVLLKNQNNSIYIRKKKFEIFPKERVLEFFFYYFCN